MKSASYRSMAPFTIRRREFMKIGAAGAGLLLGNPSGWAKARMQNTRPEKPKTNIDDALAVSRTRHSLPGPFPGKVVEVADPQATADGTADALKVKAMFENGLSALTGRNPKKSFSLFFSRRDIVGIKVNPVGAGIISTHLEVVDAVVDWLLSNGMKKEALVIWDRFDYMLTDAGFTPERYPGIRIEGLQTMDEAAAEGETADNSKWLKSDGTHVSAGLFDMNVYYWADVEGPKDDMAYLNQHVFNGKYSYFGKLLTERLTKIINIPVFKNTGNGISMATKNMGYGSICNTNRLHRPLFFDVCTEVMAFPAVRDKLVLNITDGLTGQYDGGPGANAQFAYPLNTLFLATDPFALDRICHDRMVAKRKEMGIKVNENPIFTDYLRYAETLGIGIGSPEKIVHIRV